MTLIDFIYKHWFWLILVGFLFGIGFEIAGQIIWFLGDVIKEKHQIPLG